MSFLEHLAGVSARIRRGGVPALEELRELEPYKTCATCYRVHRAPENAVFDCTGA